MERIVNTLKYGWKFNLYPSGECEPEVFQPELDDSSWQTVRVPHDWAASGSFDELNDASYRKVEADGLTAPIEHSGRTGALPIVGLGVYRLWLDIPVTARGKAITLEFDGIMWESDIYVNGKHLCFNHFGYKSFEVDITDAVSYGEPTLVAVAARVYNDCSRWYPGAGIYRNVRLVEKNATHIAYSGIWLRQLEVAQNSAFFELELEHNGDETVELRAEILSPDGEVVANVAQKQYLGELSTIFELPNVQLWDIDSPRLYTAKVSLVDANGELLDAQNVKFGARFFEFTSDKGFFLNGRHLKLNGACSHHDLGSLGAAFNAAAMLRQLRILREMGVNAIRTSHNPPAPELLDLCDELGFVVMDEFFDEWYCPKVANGYAKYFRAHAEQDVEDVIKRDRNHPSVIMWSIGNEIGEQYDKEGWRAAKLLAEVCRRVDPTRPTTAGFNDGVDVFKNHLMRYVDILGLNYKPHMYAKYHEEHPNLKILGAETASCVSTRGVYKLPAEVAIPCNKHDDLTVSAYEMEAPGWAYYAEREFAVQDDCEFVAGEFIWTGFDYLGEPTPYYSEWPSRSSYFGAVDLAGIPKNRFWGYKAKWTDDEVLHVFPHWSWEGHEGEVVPVHVYTSYPEAEVFVNGKSYGRQTFGDRSGGALGQIERFRLMWNNTVFEPGELKVVAYDSDGNPAAEKVILTAGAPHHIELCADRTEIAADGDDLVYVTAAVVDENGTVCPHSDARIFFGCEGAELLTTDNGDQREVESFARADKRCLAGKVVACVRSILGEAGVITISAKSDGLAPAKTAVECR